MTELSKEEEIKIMEGQLQNFDSLLDKMRYMNEAFDNDPMFSREARDIIRSNIANTLPK
jgi:hypothetical protein